MLTNFDGNEAKKKIFFAKKISKWPTQKNWVFQPPPKAEQFSPKFHKLVFGWVGSIDTKGIHFAKPKWSSGCPTEAQFTAKNTKNAFLAVNWAYIRQPDDHIGWTKWMPFALTDPTHPRTNLWNFGKNCSAFGGGWSRPFWIFFCFISLKNAARLYVWGIIFFCTMDGFSRILEKKLSELLCTRL